MRATLPCMLVLLGALLACKKESAPAEQQAVAEPAPAPAAPAPPEETIADFRGVIISNWGKATCTQVKRNVNCLYAGKSGSMDCKVVGENELDCEWEEPGASGKAKLTKKADGKVSGTWGNGSSATNGGAWVFKPAAK